MCLRLVAGFRVGQSVHVAGRDGVQVLGDARGVPRRLRDAQGGRANGRRRADRERDGVRGDGEQRPVAGRGARRSAGRAGGHVLRAGGPQRRVRDTVGAMGTGTRARAPRGHRADGARAAGDRMAGVDGRAARARAHQQPAHVLVYGAGEEAEVSERLRTARLAYNAHAL